MFERCLVPSPGGSDDIPILLSHVKTDGSRTLHTCLGNNRKVVTAPLSPGARDWPEVLLTNHPRVTPNPKFTLLWEGNKLTTILS